MLIINTKKLNSNICDKRYDKVGGSFRKFLGNRPKISQKTNPLKIENKTVCSDAVQTIDAEWVTSAGM